MTDLKLRGGDYIPSGTGGFLRAEGNDALLERCMLKLAARRGSFPLMPGFGSLLYTLPRVPHGERLSAALKFASEALSDEDATVTSAQIEYTSGGMKVTFEIDGGDGTAELSLGLS